MPLSRYFRFRLRTLLVLATLVCVCSAVVAWVIESQQRAAESRRMMLRDGEELEIMEAIMNSPSLRMSPHAPPAPLPDELPRPHAPAPRAK